MSTCGRIILTVIFFGISLISGKNVRYQPPNECDWVLTDDDSTSIVDETVLNDDSNDYYDDTKIALVCKLRTINSELEKTNFSIIPPQHTVRLRLQCSDSFYQSSLSAGSFRPLFELRELSIEYCKLANLTAGAFKGLSELRNLTIRTHNIDWPLISLELSSSTFTDELNLLERLDLGENNIIILPEGIFCPLKSLEVLNLTKNRLRDIVNLKLSAKPMERCNGNLNILDLSYNNIEMLQMGTLSGLTRLRKFYMQNNGLGYLADRALEGLTSVNVIKFSNNKLTNLPPELFIDTRELRELYLQNNSINILAPGLFSELAKLQVLDLSRNELTNEWINSATFVGLFQLVVLDISFNRITKLESPIFRDLFNLQILRFSDNFIETIAEGTFLQLFNLHTLTMSNNRLITIDSFTLNGLNSLAVLSIDNNLLTSLDKECLKNCTNLQDLHLSGNKLTSVPDIFHNVPTLRTLDLGENRISQIDENNFKHMKNMFGLRLSENNIVNITKNIFSKMVALKILNLSKNKIQKIEQEAFDLNINLQALRLDGNHLSEIAGLFSKLPNLVWLNMSHNHLEWFDYALIPTGLQWLDIHANKITELGNFLDIESNLQLNTFDASFNKLTEITSKSIPNSVETLYLNDNLISKIQSYTFFKKPNLTRVELFGNQLTSLDPNSLRISTVPEGTPLPEFYIASNPYECDCTMDWLQKINDINFGQPRNQPRIMDLEDIYCELMYSRGTRFLPLLDVAPHQFLCKYESHCFAVCNCCNLDNCDCEMKCPINCTCYHDQFWSAANIVDCALSGYYKRMPMTVSKEVTQLYLDGNDIGTLTNYTFINRRRLKILYLNASNIDNILNSTFSDLTELEILRLDENRLVELKGFEFNGLDNLRELFLQHNRISYINNITFQNLNHLKILKLDHNKLKTFYIWELSSLSISELTLSSNPWSCECEFTEKLRDYMLRGTRVTDLNSVRCIFSTTNLTDLDYYSENIYSDRPEYGFFIIRDNITMCTGTDKNSTSNLTLTKTIIEKHRLGVDYTLLTYTLVAFTVLIILILIMFIFRQEMRVWLHSRFGVRLFHRTNEYDMDEHDKLFDAFISYSSKDEAFVMEELAPVLEHGDPQYKLCLHYRDFPVGGFIADTIVQAVEASKRTIMILSENFIKSEWCRFEFKSAHHQVLRDRRKRLIVILLGEVPNKDLDPDIRLYLKTNTYLQWGDKLFWEKLKFALPDVPNTRRIRHHHGPIGLGGGTTRSSNIIRNSTNYNLHHLHHHVHHSRHGSGDRMLNSTNSPNTNSPLVPISHSNNVNANIPLNSASVAASGRTNSPRTVAMHL